MNKVSVIIPCYNSEKYISKCLNSILNQTYSNIEIIIIDDGSTDNSVNIIQNNIENRSNVIFIKNKNNGVSYTRNLGLEKASGKYVMFVDSDDYLNDNKTIEKIINYILKYNTDVVRFNFIKEKDNKFINSKPVYSKVKYIEKENYNKSLYRKILSTETLNSACLTLYKKDIIENNKIKFNVELKNGEDAVFFMDYIENTNSFLYLPNLYYTYYIKNEGLSGNGIDINSMIANKISFINILKQKELDWNLIEKNLVNKKIIYIAMSTIYTLYVKNKTLSSEIKNEKLVEIINKFELIKILKSTDYSKLNFTKDRVKLLNYIKNNDLNKAIETINDFK